MHDDPRAHWHRQAVRLGGHWVRRRDSRQEAASPPGTAHGAAEQRRRPSWPHHHERPAGDGRRCGLERLARAAARDQVEDVAIIEQVIADLKNGPLAHLLSGLFTANAAWLVLATIAFNFTRAAGCLASALHARATTATLRTQLIAVPARLARSARRLVLHLPQHWPWQQALEQLVAKATGPPAAVSH